MTQPPVLASSASPDMGEPPRRGRTAWWAVVFVAMAVTGGGAYFVHQLRSGTRPPAGAAALEPAPPADSAANAAPLDSIIRPADLPGFETEGLSDGQRLWLYHQAHLEQCSCGCGMNVAQCRVEDLTCPVSPGRARELVAEAARRES